MANIHSEEYIYKYGRLVQFGVAYMQGFSAFADLFVSTLNSYQQELSDYGYSINWVYWQKQNSADIVKLYNELDAQNLIPTTPV
jgi:hypothetical protein